MLTHDHPHDGEPRSNGRRRGYFPLVPGLLHDPRLSELTWQERYVFVALLANAWRGVDRNGRFVPGQVIRPIPELATDLGIRVDHLRAEITRMASLGLLELGGGRVIVAVFGSWHTRSVASDDPGVDSQNGNPRPAEAVPDSENRDPLPRNWAGDPKNWVTPPRIWVEDPNNRVADPQNWVVEGPSAQQAQGFGPSVRRLSETSSKSLSESSSSDVPAAAAAATVTATAGDDDRTGPDSDSNLRDNGHGNGHGNGSPPTDDLEPSSPSGPRGEPEQGEGSPRGHPAASPTPVNDPVGDEQVEDLLRRAGLTAALARRYRGTVTPDEARDLMEVFRRYYVDKGQPEKVIPCLVSALSQGRDHVQSVIRGSRAQPGYRRVDPGSGTTAGEPRRAETAEGLERSRADNRRRRQALGELANRL